MGLVACHLQRNEDPIYTILYRRQDRIILIGSAARQMMIRGIQQRAIRRAANEGTSCAESLIVINCVEFWTCRWLVSGREHQYPTYRLSIVGAACYRARDTIQLGRKVESVLHAFLTEQTIHKAYWCFFSNHAYTSTPESNERNLWSNASVRTALEAKYGFEKAHSILANLWETGENIAEIYALLDLITQMNNESRYSGQGENALLKLRAYLASKGKTVSTRSSILEVLEEQIEHIKILNKNVSRLLSCPNQPNLSCGDVADSQMKTLQYTESSLPSTYIAPILIRPLSISKQLQSLLSLDINPETQETLPLFHPSSSSFLADQEPALPSYSMTLPRKLPWWKILLASPHRSFFIVQALLFILGIGVTTSWASWKGDLGTATGCGGLVFAVGSTANMVWDKCHSSRTIEPTFLLKES
ncbi:hypothetical protein BKA64DRAFT_752632 [Cadophora sp. MPI-SDFR-AT-0126]|nr:hypothetical protein BKA64DRAFT_752632 [Leotiomycetes sp. MPI-SDFR-AT-0126]